MREKDITLDEMLYSSKILVSFLSKSYCGHAVKTFPKWTESQENSLAALENFISNKTDNHADCDDTQYVENFYPLLSFLATEKFDGLAILCEAANEGCTEMVKLLLGHEGIDANQTNSLLNWTPLSFAAHNGNEAMVKILLAHEGTDVNLVSEDSAPPLCLAAQQGHTAIVSLLLAHSKIDAQKSNKYGRTALDFAIYGGKPDVVALLMAHNRMDPIVRFSISPTQRAHQSSPSDAASIIHHFR